MDNSDKKRVQSYIQELLYELDDHNPFSDSESLIKTGRLDSLVVVKLVLFLESEFQVDFTRVEFDPDRFDCVNEILAVIDESRG